MADRFLTQGSLRDFLAALASGEEAHGAVVASAMAAGMGASLLLMVAALPKTRSDSVDDRMVLASTAAALGGVREQLMEAIETQTAVNLFAARNMPQASRAEREQREAALQLALRAAADVPLEVMRLCAVCLQHAETVAARSVRAASADVELAVALIDAGFNGARSSLERKLGSLTDAVYVASVVDQIASLSDDATARARAAVSLVHTPPA